MDSFLELVGIIALVVLGLIAATGIGLLIALMVVAVKAAIKTVRGADGSEQTKPPVN
jgi:hypothetical protein